MQKRFTLGLPVLFLAWATVSQGAARLDKLTYHNDPQRTGWNASETVLTPRTVVGDGFGLMWRSESFDLHDGLAARLYATPLYVDKIKIGAGEHRGKVLSVLYAVGNTAYVYAVNAFATPQIAPGAILWRTRLTDKPCAGGAFGVLSTPVIDLGRNRLYVTSCDDQEHWRAHALDLRSGVEFAGWPVKIDRAAVNAPGINKNGAAAFPDQHSNVQRGALNLKADGSRLYVTFGGEASGVGWIIAIDTVRAQIASAFSSTATSEEAQGGIWASGGPAIDREGRVHLTTGSNFIVVARKMGLQGVFPERPRNWGQSLIQLTDDRDKGFELVGTYTPFNYCQSSMADIDLGSSGATVIDLDPKTTSTPHLLTFGGKQGNAYLLDRARMPGDLVRRQACSTDPSSDKSLLSPDVQPHLGARGPLNVFGPYSDVYGMNDQARSRTTPAYFRDANGRNYVFVSGSAKAGKDLTISTPPGLARLEIVTTPGQLAYLQVDQLEQTQTFHNPGSPIVTSDGGMHAIVWVLDENAPRTTPLYGAAAPKPVLYAFDALSLKLLWKSKPGMLAASGRYNEPTVVHGTVFVGTNRLEAFGLGEKIAAEQASPEPPTKKYAKGDSALSAVAVLGIDGARLYEQRCVMCHGSGQPGIPQRAALAELDQRQILETLRSGIMRAQASGLSEAEMLALAAYLVSSKNKESH